MIGLSFVPVADKDTNLFSLHRRPINRRSHGRSTCCGSEKKFRNVQIRYARCTRFGCKYRGPIGVSSSRTPSLSFSIHIDLAHLERRPTPPLLLKRAIIAPEMGQWELNFRGGPLFYFWIKLRNALEGGLKGSATTGFQLISGNNSMRSRVAAMPIPLPSDSCTRTTEASQSVHPPGPNPRPGGSMMTSSSFEPSFTFDSE